MCYLHVHVLNSLFNFVLILLSYFDCPQPPCLPSSYEILYIFFHAWSRSRSRSRSLGLGLGLGLGLQKSRSRKSGLPLERAGLGLGLGLDSLVSVSVLVSDMKVSTTTLVKDIEK